MGDIHYLHRGGFPPLDPATIGKAMRDGRAYRTVRPAPPELHKQVADLDEWLNRRRPFDRQRLQQLVTVAALVVAWFAIIYFAFSMGRGL